jgi:hypothetical protein
VLLSLQLQYKGREGGSQSTVKIKKNITQNCCGILLF